MKTKALLTIILAITLVSCASASISAPTEMPTPTTIITLTPIPASTSPTFSFPDSPTTLKEYLLKSLNDPSQKSDWLKKNPYFKFNIDVRSEDINNDSLPDIVTTYSINNYNELSKSGIFIFVQDDSQYSSKYEFSTGDWGGAIEVRGIMDLNGDGLPEIITRFTFGGSYCNSVYQVISMVDGKYVNIFPPYDIWDCNSYLILATARPKDGFNAGKVVFDIHGKRLTSTTSEEQIPEQEPIGGRFTFFQKEPFVTYEPVYKFDY